MVIEESHLRNGCGADESRFLIELRTGFHTAAARDASRQGVSFFLHRRRLPRAGAKIIGSVHRYPRLHALQVFEEYAAIDGQVTNDGKLGEWFQADGLLELVDQRRARHLGLPVDDHGAGAADLFQAVGVVGLPSRVTGLAAMSISAEVTFMPRRYSSSNSSQ